MTAAPQAQPPAGRGAVCQAARAMAGLAAAGLAAVFLAGDFFLVAMRIRFPRRMVDQCSGRWTGMRTVGQGLGVAKPFFAFPTCFQGSCERQVRFGRSRPGVFLVDA